MSRLTLIGAWVLLSLLTAPLHGQEANRAQIIAATQDAVQSLYAQIASQPIGEQGSVGKLLDATDGKPILMATLQRAEQLGGPRWLDENTCQIKLSIGGASVVSALTRIAAINPGSTTVDAESLQWMLRDWDRRTFVATGTSTGSGVLPQLAPPDGAASPWSSIDEVQRRKVVGDAQADAVQRIVARLEMVHLTASQTIQNILDADGGSLRRALVGYLNGCPVSRVEFTDDLRVRLTVTADGQDVFDLIYQGAPKVGAGDLPDGPQEWMAVRQRIIAAVVPTIGSARLSESGATSRPIAASLKLDEPPTWAREQLQAAATAPASGTKLRTARVAERAARVRLSHEVMDLPVGDHQTIGALVVDRPDLLDAVERALERARVYKTDYHSDGSVETKVSLDLRGLWQELTERP